MDRDLQVPLPILSLRSGSAEVTIDPSNGGRLASWTVGEYDLLFRRTPTEGCFGWGSFVMAPYAGRVRRGRMAFDGKAYSLPIAMEPHAIHGTTYDVAWDVVELTESSARLRVNFGSDWPFGGHIEHRIELFDGSLRQTLTAFSPQVVAPITMGWHPWFPRYLRTGGSEVQWSFDRVGVSMFERDRDGIATSTMVGVPQGRVDDCFAGVGTVRVEWPGEFAFDVEHDCPVVVLFDGLEHAVCVEPQTGPPDAVNGWPGRYEVSPDKPVSATCIWRWEVA